jgi:hypothetical protein
VAPAASDEVLDTEIVENTSNGKRMRVKAMRKGLFDSSNVCVSFVLMGIHYPIGKLYHWNWAGFQLPKFFPTPREGRVRLEGLEPAPF